MQPEVEQLLLKRAKGPRPRVSMRTRVAQAFAYRLTRGDSALQSYYLPASKRTIEKWAERFRQGPWPWRRKPKGGRPPLGPEVKDLIVRLKKDNPLWGARRIQDELRRVGITVGPCRCAGR